MTWEEKENALTTTLKFRDFSEAFAFMIEVAFQCEKMNHHPNWKNSYNVVEFSLSTHSAGDVVTEKDHKLAGEIDRIYKKYCKE
jgi:4a-hydroxytetrahydrobiopterin dehydratase